MIRTVKINSVEPLFVHVYHFFFCNYFLSIWEIETFLLYEISQISDPNEVYSEKRVADKPLTEDQMIAETLSLVASDFRIFTAGTYWDINKFTNRTLFAPFAYRKVDGTDHASRKFKIEDLARLNKPSELDSQIVISPA